MVTIDFDNMIDRNTCRRTNYDTARERHHTVLFIVSIVPLTCRPSVLEYARAKESLESSADSWQYRPAEHATRAGASA